MIRIGRVINLTPNHKIILKADEGYLPKIGDLVFTESSRMVGEVFDIVGPTSSPYISVTPKSLDSINHTNQVLYTKKVRKKRGRKFE